MFSVLHRLLQMVLGRFLLKKRSSRWWSECVGCPVITSVTLSNISHQICCGRKWRVTSCCCHCNFRNSRAAPVSSLSLQPWNGISVRRGSLVLLLKHCCISSGFPEVVFNVSLTVREELQVLPGSLSTHTSSSVELSWWEQWKLLAIPLFVQGDFNYGCWTSVALQKCFVTSLDTHFRL